MAYAHPPSWLRFSLRFFWDHIVGIGMVLRHKKVKSEISKSNYTKSESASSARINLVFQHETPRCWVGMFMFMFIVTWVISTRVYYEWIPLLTPIVLIWRCGSCLVGNHIRYPPRPQLHVLHQGRLEASPRYLMHSYVCTSLLGEIKTPSLINKDFHPILLLSNQHY